MKLRPYQQDAVDAVIHHFRRRSEPAVLVLPTGAGKSLVIAELARKAKGRVLVEQGWRILTAKDAVKDDEADDTSDEKPEPKEGA